MTISERLGARMLWTEEAKLNFMLREINDIDCMMSLIVWPICHNGGDGEDMYSVSYSGPDGPDISMELDGKAVEQVLFSVHMDIQRAYEASRDHTLIGYARFYSGNLPQGEYEEYKAEGKKLRRELNATLREKIGKAKEDLTKEETA